MFAKKALGAAPAAVPLYIEDTFSTYLYTGNATARTITNNIDLLGEGGLVWLKDRSASNQHFLFDSGRGATNYLSTSTTGAENQYGSSTDMLTAFTSSGFSLGADASGRVNTNGSTFASWTFRKAEKFFDVVTYTGTGSARTVSHNLGSTPGFIIVKRTDDVGSWACYHTSIGNQRYLKLESTAAQSNTGAGWWNNTSPTSTEFTVGTDPYVNSSGATYVAYLFAHDAGGFGDDGDQSVIKCGSFTSNSSGVATVDLGWEPQWLLFKRTDSTQNWYLMDNMRNFIANPGDSSALYPNLSNAENAFGQVAPTATGFSGSNFSASATYIYIAIRRGPMKTPEAGTEVFTPLLPVTDNGSNTGNELNNTYNPRSNPLNAGFTVDSFMWAIRDDSSFGGLRPTSRLTGSPALLTSSTAAQTTATYPAQYDTMDGVYFNGSYSSFNNITYAFKRAPGFFDVVCYTGTGSVTNFNHSLGVAPELWITKRRDSAGNWTVGSSLIPASDYLFLHTNAAKDTTTGAWDSTYPTSSVFTVGTSTSTNTSGGTYVAYLFASVTGVSKVGSYTGNGSSQTINCGFTAGARFVLIKRTDSTGDWVVFDSARGIVSGNDPYLRLNSTAAEVTDKDAVDTDNTGFVVNETTGPNVNTNGASYIFLAVS